MLNHNNEQIEINLIMDNNKYYKITEIYVNSNFLARMFFKDKFDFAKYLIAMNLAKSKKLIDNLWNGLK